MPVGSGQVGDCFRIILDWKQEKDSPSSLIAKCPADNQSSRDTARNLHLYEIETSFFKFLSPRCKARVPECYFDEYDSKTGEFICSVLGTCLCGCYNDWTTERTLICH